MTASHIKALLMLLIVLCSCAPSSGQYVPAWEQFTQCGPGGCAPRIWRPCPPAPQYEPEYQPDYEPYEPDEPQTPFEPRPPQTNPDQEQPPPALPPKEQPCKSCDCEQKWAALEVKRKADAETLECLRKKDDELRMLKIEQDKLIAALTAKVEAQATALSKINVEQSVANYIQAHPIDTPKPPSAEEVAAILEPKLKPPASDSAADASQVKYYDLRPHKEN